MAPVAIITGAGGTMGSAIGQKLASDGYDLVLTDLRAAAVEKAATALRESGVRVQIVLADVRNVAQTQLVVQEAIRNFDRVDLLVNTAGGHTAPVPIGPPSEPGQRPDWEVMLLPRQPFHETTPEEWDIEIGANLMGTLNCTHAVIPQMIAQQSGVIINISSGHGLKNTPLKHAPTFAIYSAAKAGVIAFTRCIAVELGQYSIRANCVAPGWTVTPWSGLSEQDIERIAADVPLGRMTYADDVAETVSFLASSRAGHITGVCLAVNGGAILH